MKIDLHIPGASPEQIEKYRQIFTVLIEKGALDGVKGGQAIIHFGPNAEFMGVQLSYWPWKKKKFDNSH